MSAPVAVPAWASSATRAAAASSAAGPSRSTSRPSAASATSETSLPSGYAAATTRASATACGSASRPTPRREQSAASGTSRPSNESASLSASGRSSLGDRSSSSRSTSALRRSWVCPLANRETVARSHPRPVGAGGAVGTSKRGSSKIAQTSSRRGDGHAGTTPPSMPNSRRRPRTPAGVTVSARSFGRRTSQPAATRCSASAAPSAPAT